MFHFLFERDQIRVMNVAAALLWTSLVVMNFVTSHQSVVFKPEPFTDLGAGCGHAQQCAGSKQNFTLEYCPTSIALSQPLKISFAVTPLMDHKAGKMCTSVYLDQSPDFNLLYKGCSSFECGTINKQFPNVCPFRKDVSAKGTASIDLNKFTTTIPVGQFKVRMDIINMSGEEFLCAEVHFKIQPPSDADDYDY